MSECLAVAARVRPVVYFTTSTWEADMLSSMGFTFVVSSTGFRPKPHDAGCDRTQFTSTSS